MGKGLVIYKERLDNMYRKVWSAIGNGFEVFRERLNNIWRERLVAYMERMRNVSETTS